MNRELRFKRGKAPRQRARKERSIEGNGGGGNLNADSPMPRVEGLKGEKTRGRGSWQPPKERLHDDSKDESQIAGT